MIGLNSLLGIGPARPSAAAVDRPVIRGRAGAGCALWVEGHSVFEGAGRARTDGHGAASRKRERSSRRLRPGSAKKALVPARAVRPRTQGHGRGVLLPRTTVQACPRKHVAEFGGLSWIIFLAFYSYFLFTPLESVLSAMTRNNLKCAIVSMMSNLKLSRFESLFDHDKFSNASESESRASHCQCCAIPGQT
jgi:hypothetical protein